MSLPHRAIPHASHHTPRRNRLATSLIVLGVVAATGVALAGPANLMRELRARFESPRGARIERDPHRKDIKTVRVLWALVFGSATGRN